jgi:hypothetical protein
MLKKSLLAIFVDLITSLVSSHARQRHTTNEFGHFAPNPIMTGWVASLLYRLEKSDDKTTYHTTAADGFRARVKV